jgi:hypothetical protein
MAGRSPYGTDTASGNGRELRAVQQLVDPRTADTVSGDGSGVGQYKDLGGTKQFCSQRTESRTLDPEWGNEQEAGRRMCSCMSGGLLSNELLPLRGLGLFHPRKKGLRIHRRNSGH